MYIFFKKTIGILSILSISVSCALKMTKKYFGTEKEKKERRSGKIIIISE